MIQPTGFFRAKTDSADQARRRLVADFGGEVPNRLAKLATLPGVGRKTANVVLGNAFGIPGITVDTHVGRLSRRLGFTADEDPVKVETGPGRDLPPQGLDDAVAPADLPRPADLPLPQAGLRGLPGLEAVPELRSAGETDPVPRPRSWSRGRPPRTSRSPSRSARDRRAGSPTGSPRSPQRPAGSGRRTSPGPGRLRSGAPPAVLLLFEDGPDGPDVLLTQRAATLRSHAGQVSVPGGPARPRRRRAAGRGAARGAGGDPPRPAGVQVAGAFPNSSCPGQLVLGDAGAGLVGAPLRSGWSTRPR